MQCFKSLCYLVGHRAASGSVGVNMSTMDIGAIENDAHQRYVYCISVIGKLNCLESRLPWVRLATKASTNMD